MLQGIFLWLADQTVELVEIVTGIYLEAMVMNPSEYLSSFSLLGTAYHIFRGIGFGLVLVLGALSLLKFMIPEILGKGSMETVPGTLAWTAAAAGMVYGGNYLLEVIIETANIPYQRFLGVTAEAVYLDLPEELYDCFGLRSASVFLYFILTVLAGWEILKLLIEVGERYMAVGILLYTSPPFFAMAASSETRQYFRKWLSMFISSTVMMILSAFFFKTVLSGLNGLCAETDGTAAFVRLIMVFATVRLAQRADSYLAQTGLNTAATGGHMISEITDGSVYAARKTIRAVTGDAKTVLGMSPRDNVSYMPDTGGKE